jgi:rhamnosyltransferase
MTLKASVVIPVKNGGELLRQVLQAVQAQQTPWPFEILVIDSGSRDGSTQIVRELGLRLHEIPPQEFGHGRTRNLGGQLTAGDFIVFITQDALPTDEHWLHNLVAATELSENTAGAFGRHFAYPQHGPVSAQELQAHFAGFGEQANTVCLDDSKRYRQDQGYRQFLHFFSSNNACLRRSVWQQIPLPEVDFAEDQLWAKAVIEAGYAKAYAPDACVFHSHKFGILESYKRAFDESNALHELFGYELVPGFKHLLKHSVLLSQRDWRWIKQSALPARNKGLGMIKTPAANFSRLLGYYVGAKQTRLPSWLKEHSSRDKALQRS